jgi:hypothetical protein
LRRRGDQYARSKGCGHEDRQKNEHQGDAAAIHLLRSATLAVSDSARRPVRIPGIRTGVALRVRSVTSSRAAPGGDGP